MNISLSEQIKLAALDHQLSDQYPDLAAQMKVFAYCSERPVRRQQSCRLNSWARHLVLWTVGIAVTALLALLLLPALAGPTRCVQPAPGHGPSGLQLPAACARAHTGG
jgi:hypothetical protein